MKSFIRQNIIEENRKDTSFDSSTTSRIDIDKYIFNGINKKYNTPCKVIHLENINSIDLCRQIAKKNPLISSTKIVLLNSRNNQEEIMIRTDMVKTGVIEDNGVYSTRVLNIIRDKDYKKINAVDIVKIKCITITPVIQPKLKREMDRLYKTYLLEEEYKRMYNMLFYYFDIANQMDCKILVIDNVGIDGYYRNPFEDILIMIKEMITKYRYCFNEIYLCFDDPYKKLPKIINFI